MEAEQSLFIKNKILEAKAFSADLFLPLSFCDVCDNSKNWRVCQILERVGDMITVHYDGYLNKSDEKVSIKKTTRVNYFRKFTKGYTGLPKIIRNECITIDNLKELQFQIKSIIKSKFILGSPFEITQSLTGKVFTQMDIIMTTSYGQKDLASCIPLVMEIIFNLLDMIVDYLKFFEANVSLVPILAKNSDLYLVDNKFAVLAALDEILLMLQRILGHDARVSTFYSSYEEAIKKHYPLFLSNNFKKKISIEKAYKPNATIDYNGNKIPTCLIAYIIDYFNDKGGFDLLINIVLKNRILPFETVKSILKPLGYIYWITGSFKTCFSSELKALLEYVIYRINNMNENEIKENKEKTVVDFIKSVTDIPPSDQRWKLNCFEDIYLSYYFKCLSSKNLEKRIFALNSLNRIMEWLDDRDFPTYGFHQVERDQYIVDLDSKGFLLYIKEKGIIDLLLGENIHEELMKRASQLFNFLARRNWGFPRGSADTSNYSTHVYDNLWKNFMEKHESVSLQIEGIICELCLFINEKDRLYLFSKIKAYAASALNLDLITKVETLSSGSNSNMSNQIINLIRNFTENCFRKANYSISANSQLDIFSEQKMYGLPLLWNFMQDSFNVVNSTNSMIPESTVHQQCVDIINLCEDSIKRLMDLNAVDDQIREAILILCLENVQKKCSVVQSLSLFKHIINDSFRGVKGKRLLKKIDDTVGGITNCVITDFERYMSHVLTTTQDLPKQTENLLNLIFEGYYSHEINIKTRLNIIYFLSGNSSKDRKIPLQNEHVQRLWDILALQGDAYESDLLYESLNANIEELEMKMIEFIFQKILLDKDKFISVKLSKKALNMFKTFFFEVNISYGHLIKDQTTNRIQSAEILGMDTLWNMLVLTTDEDSRTEIAKLLGEMCLDLKSFTEDFTTLYWGKYLDKLYTTLNECYTSQLENGIKGVITVIKYIFSHVGLPGDVPKYNECTWQQMGSEYYSFICPDKNDQKYLIKVGYNDLFYEVRWKVASYYDIPVNHIRMKNGKKIYDLSSDFEPFRNLFHPSSMIEILERQHPILSLKNPKVLIQSDQKLVKILFELLHDSEKSFIQDAWELINMLPKNNELEEEIGALGKGVKSNLNWKKYFDEKSIYVMSYTLKTIEGFLFSDIRDDNEQNTLPSLALAKSHSFNVDWIANFCANKGSNTIVNLIFQIKLEHFKLKSNLGFECLNLLLSIMKPILFLSNSDQLLGLNTEFSISSDLTLKLIQKVVELMQLIVEASLDKDTDVVLLELQEKYSQKREKEKNALASNDEGNEDEILLKYSNEYCDEIIKIWNEENKSIEKLINFLDVLNQKETFLMCLLSEYENEMWFLFTKGIICSKNDKLKQTFHNFVHSSLMSTEINDKVRDKFKSNLFEMLLSRSTLSLANEKKETSGYFFKMIASLLEDHLNLSKTDISNVDFISLAEYIVQYLQSIDDDPSSDHVVEGYLRILRVLVLKSRDISDNFKKNHDLLDIVLSKCLLTKCQMNPLAHPFPKCKTENSRQSAFQLMSAISYNDPYMMTRIINLLSELHALGFWKSKRFLDWRISLTLDEKSSTGYVGLKNLGCTCYMNSLFQQFFMIPQLRETILASNDNTNSISSSLFQIKNIFASLKACESQFYNAKDFCTNFDGQVLDIREQMDVDEFFNTLIDKLESHLKETNYIGIFKHFFGGNLSDELIFKGCPHTSQNQVFFNSIQLQVTNKKSILESLKSFVEGEMMEGDNAIHCEKCDKKYPALKRQSFKTLPRMLMIVMKRFEFNYDSMAKIKVNDYCEFPMELDMEPYTQEYLRRCEREKSEADLEIPNSDKASFLYHLVGVLIHSGNSESGHYYSIIKDPEKDSWYEFNDTNVRPYDINDLKNDAFGGIDIVCNTENQKETVEKVTNAYLLFYKKFLEVKEDSCLQGDSDVNIITSVQCPIITQWDKLSNISPSILDRINQETFQYWVLKALFSTEYQRFIIDLLVNSYAYDHITVNYLTKNDNFDLIPKELDLRVISASMIKNNNIDKNIIYNFSEVGYLNDYVIINNKDFDLNLFKFACSFFFNVIIRARDRHYLPHIVDIIKAFINKDPTNADWLLEEFSYFDIISEYIVDSPMFDIRSIIIGILYASMIKIYKSEKFTVGHRLKMFSRNVLSYIMKFKGCEEKDMTYVYAILYRFASLGIECKKFLIEIGVLRYLTLLYYKKLDRLPETQEKFIEASNELTIDYIKPTHYELNVKLTNKVDRFSAVEESLEKKHSEKLINGRHDSYLLLTFCEIALICDLNPKFGKSTTPQDKIKIEDKMLVNILKMTNTVLLHSLLSEVKSKSAAIAISVLMQYTCFNNKEITEAFQSVLLHTISTMDSLDLEYYMIIFKWFLIKIDDDLKDFRLKSTLLKYFQILEENMTYYSYMDFHIDFVINFFQKNQERLNDFMELFKDGFTKLLRFLKENPVSPKYTPNRYITMYKKGTYSYSNKVNPSQIRAFEEKSIILSKEKRDKLFDIFKKVKMNKTGYDSDLDLTDFKFSVKDKVTFEGINAVVIATLDEMIQIEYNKNEIMGQKRPPTQWVETNNKLLVLKEIYDYSEMMNEK